MGAKERAHLRYPKYRRRYYDYERLGPERSELSLDYRTAPEPVAIRTIRTGMPPTTRRNPATGEQQQPFVDDEQPGPSGTRQTPPPPPLGARDDHDLDDDEEDTPPAPPAVDRELEEMDAVVIQQMLDEAEAVARKKRNIQRLMYLKQGGTGTEQEQLLEQQRATMTNLPYDSYGKHKRFASRDFDHSSKSLRPAAPESFDGSSYDGLEDWLMSAELYFEAINKDLADADDGTQAIKTAATWLGGDARKAYVRSRPQIATWADFVVFLRGVVKDPQTRVYEATRALLYTKQRSTQTARQYLHDLEHAEAEVVAARLTPEEQASYRFLQGLRGDIRAAIMAEPAEVRATRDSLLSAAVRHEARMGIGSEAKGKDKPKEDNRSSKGGDRSSTPKPSARRTQNSRTNSTGNRARSGGQPPRPPTETFKKVRHEESTKVEQRPPPICYNCGKVGHKADVCRSAPAKKDPGK